MVLNLIHCGFRYEMEKLSMAFFPDQKFLIIEEPPYHPAEYLQQITVKQDTPTSGKVRFTVSFTNGTNTVQKEETVAETEILERCAGRVLYKTLSEATGVVPPWGILTGVRPSKLMTSHMLSEGDEAALSYFEEKLLVDPKRAELALQVAKTEQKIMKHSCREAYSLYVSIPFCPNRCSYCSFVSHSIATSGAKKLLPEYFENLLLELKETGAIMKGRPSKLRSVYIGGGTPSTLTAEQIRRLISCIQENFDLQFCQEFTFEAGRPDTITTEKLIAIYESGVDRISINPQTMTDSILASIGRTHSTDDVVNTFKEARKIGFRNINMDLIAGLEGDSPENFNRSLQEVLALEPESITVHTLAYKRSSNTELSQALFNRSKDTARMVDYSMNELPAQNYIPYYMYRQTRSVGNLENIGWSKPGCESYYNIYMMEECHSILACGAGAVTKLKDPDSNEIRRIFNLKYPYEYNRRFQEILDHKLELTAFLNEVHL